MNKFCKRLISLRKSKNMTQQELAKNLGIGKTTISNYETGYSSPDIEMLSKIATYFNVSADFLLGREKKYIADSFQITGEEKEVIKSYRNLTAENKNVFNSFIVALEEQSVAKEDTDKKAM